MRAVRTQDERATRREAGKTFNGDSCPFPHHVIERASDQQEKQKSDRCVEIGMWPAVERFVQA